MNRTPVISLVFLLAFAVNTPQIARAGTLFIEGPGERGEAPLPVGGGEFTIDIYAEGFHDPPFGGFQIGVDFLLDGIESDAFLIALDGGPIFQGCKVVHNTTDFPEVFGVANQRRTVGFVSMEKEYEPVTGDYLGPKPKPIYEKTWLFTVTYEYTANAVSGDYVLTADPHDTAVSDTCAEELPFDVIPGSLRICSADDFAPPSPDPMTWSAHPSAGSPTSITMAAATGADVSGVEYYFEEMSGNPGGSDSGWQDSPEYTDTGLRPATTYTYRVKARDECCNHNETAWSVSRSATTHEDVAAPSPDPMTWVVKPRATGLTSIIMIATIAADPSGVEYYFEEMSGNPGGSDSGWRARPDYTDGDLTPGMTYTYRVKARDESANRNETAYSVSLSATTPVSGAVLTIEGPGEKGEGAVDTATGETTIDVYAENVPSFGGLKLALEFLMGGEPSDAFDIAGGGSETFWGARVVHNSDLLPEILGYRVKHTLFLASTESKYDPRTGEYLGAEPKAITEKTWLVSITYKCVGALAGDYTIDIDAAVSKISDTFAAAVPFDAVRGSLTIPPCGDTDPPAPDPMTWAAEPHATGLDSITMTATTAADPSGVQYYFEETSGNPGGRDSGWRRSPEYTDMYLTPGTTYNYRVRARDKSWDHNETDWSASASATTIVPDTTPPTPDPMTWAAEPHVTSSTSITMTATTAADPSGVEYFFGEESGYPGGSSSDWQDSPNYTDTGLRPGVTYTYRVSARDKSSNHNRTAGSVRLSARMPGTPPAKLIIEGPGERGEVLQAGGGQFDVRIYAENIDDPGFGGFQIMLGFLADGVRSDAFQIAMGGGPAFQGARVIYNEVLLPQILGFCINGPTVGLALMEREYDPDTGEYRPAVKPIHDKTWLITVTYDYTADALPGDYVLAADPDNTIVSDPDAEFVPVHVIPGSLTIAAPDDLTPPTPDPMTWLVEPHAISSTAISMTATIAAHEDGVEYCFEETSGNPGGSSSGWQDSPEYTDTDLTPDLTYTYRVKARGKSPDHNETAYSVERSAATPRGWPIPGDVNGDCIVDTQDITAIKELDHQDPASGDNWRADVNEDGRINILDSLYVRVRLGTACEE